MDILSEDCSQIFKNAPVDWRLLQDTNIFLTGGTGFLGKWFLHSFIYINETLHLDSTMTVLSRSPEKFLKDNPCFDEMRNSDEGHRIIGDLYLKD